MQRLERRGRARVMNKDAAILLPPCLVADAVVDEHIAFGRPQMLLCRHARYDRKVAVELAGAPQFLLPACVACKLLAIWKAGEYAHWHAEPFASGVERGAIGHHRQRLEEAAVLCDGVPHCGRVFAGHAERLNASREVGEHAIQVEIEVLYGVW